ncbi:MAG: hypothetical protein FRX48_04161 [Lasallia pustulata]|uniref:AT hook, DNA-binding motif n=1 Tax=Lasallia pustulata TaxID=136370 RepID=A0A5M8PR69_9LECA|nr:MAG: hypothetical protein FRX48_04161 [Lasallia pustulata]
MSLNESDRPFSESEKLYLLAEILKDAAIPANTLVRIIEDAQIEPRWTEISLPHGRSVSACQKAYANLFSRSSDLLVQSLVADSAEQTSASPKKKQKRSLPTGEASTSSARSIQPRPIAFIPVNGQEGTSTVVSGERPKKKRGRPSKAEQEIRAAQAAERGEVYPPLKKVKTPRPSVEGGAPVAIMTTSPTAEAPSPPMLSADKRKRGRAGKVQPETSKKSLEATAHAVEQMQDAVEPLQAEAGQPPGEVVAETQAPEYTSPYHKLAKTHEQAEQGDVRMMEPETVRGSYTLQQLSGPPSG